MSSIFLDRFAIAAYQTYLVSFSESSNCDFLNPVGRTVAKLRRFCSFVKTHSLRSLVISILYLRDYHPFFRFLHFSMRLFPSFSLVLFIVISKVFAIKTHKNSLSPDDENLEEYEDSSPKRESEDSSPSPGRQPFLRRSASSPVNGASPNVQASVALRDASREITPTNLKLTGQNWSQRGLANAEQAVRELQPLVDQLVKDWDFEVGKIQPNFSRINYFLNLKTCCQT